MTEPNQRTIEEVFGKFINSDGTISRPTDIFPTIPPSTITDSSSPSLSKDIPLNVEKSTSIRLFLPKHSSSDDDHHQKKLHTIIYIHGGGFVFASVGHPPFHHFCSNAASQLAALVVSVEYRLAPEHRLPAAYDDVLEALEWVRDGKDEWITKYADLSSCVIMGDSAGANIVYNVGLRAIVHVDDLKPLIIKGLILVQPYFSGLDRTGSELRLVNDPVLPLVANDFCWGLALPVGENRGHEYCDPFKDDGSGLLDRVRDLGWRVWVVSCDGDPLYDRSVELVKLMEKRGVNVKAMFCEGGEHGMFNSTIIDPYKFLHIIPNSNGSIIRIKEYFPTTPPNSSISLSFSKDVPLNPNKNTWIRVYLPHKPEPDTTLPIVVYAHGGGFILLSTATPNFDYFLSNTAKNLGVIVVSIEYRLAPEHRLPTAYEDVLEALHWVRGKNDTWIKKFGDISRCIIMGESAGGNIAYNVGLIASKLVSELRPLIINGLVLIQPFFGGVTRTRSELRFGNTGGLPLVVTDLMWNLSLPIGTNRDYPYCNPLILDGSHGLDYIKELGWRVAIAGCNGDLLFDKQVEVFKLLEKGGVNVFGNFSKGDYHGVFVTEMDKAQKLFEFVRTNEDPNSTPLCTVDPYQYLQIKQNPDLTITRFLDIPSKPVTPDPKTSSNVLSRDFSLNTIHNTYVRVFIPKIAISEPSSKCKLPIIVYYHGGGFVILHADSFFNHDFCEAIASHMLAIVVSVDYRLAPEYRLPAAYEDGVDALHWIRASCVGNKHENVDVISHSTDDEWLYKYGDLSKCFLMGTSAGGNIAYNVAIRAYNMLHELKPLTIKGLILHHPYFGGLNRTGSELRLINDPYLPLSGNDLLWELSLPKGVGRDHEYCDPLSGDESSQIQIIKEMNIPMLVTDCNGDPLVDRLIGFVKVLEENGVNVKGHFTEGGYHGMELMDLKQCDELFVVLQNFLNGCLKS
ncbi:Carboxylesterase 1 [Bienertia sinuspersici]